MNGLSVRGNLGDGNERTYATGIQYSPFGGVNRQQFGTDGGPRYHMQAFNNRGQLSNVRLSLGDGSACNDGNCLVKIVNDYGAADNNGNLKMQKHFVGGAGLYIFRTSFEYDALNRLKSARETYAAGDAGANSPQAWKQTNVFDRWGNRTIDQSTSSTTTNINRLLYRIETSNNQLTVPAGASGEIEYDQVGNLARDTYAPPGIGFEGASYDAENRMRVHNGRPSCVGTVCSEPASTAFEYDGNGRRVQIYGQIDSSTFVYGADGSLVYEAFYGGREYVYLNGEILFTATNYGRNTELYWPVKDQLGTPRMVLDNFGDVARLDYLPFGEQIDPSIANRSSNGYSSGNTVRQQFTGYERDIDTGLDFAQARYFASAQGRFTSVDPARMMKERMVDPQHWNLYVYARNNPTLFVDITGEFPWTFHIRSFIYASSVGGGTFRGDGRGPSLTTGSSDITSRVRLNFTLDYDKGQITRQEIVSDPSKFNGVAGFGATTDVGRPGVSFSEVSSYDRSKGVSLHYWGKDPITPGFTTPNLDVHANIAITESITKHGNGSLFINGTFTGDKFPSTEAFIVDQSGKTRLFLGVKHEQGGVSDLYGDNKKALFSVDMQVKFDRKGNFTGVMQDGKTYSVDQWNKRVRASF